MGDTIENNWQWNPKLQLCKYFVLSTASSYARNDCSDASTDEESKLEAGSNDVWVKFHHTPTPPLI